MGRLTTNQNVAKKDTRNKKARKNIKAKLINDFTKMGLILNQNLMQFVAPLAYFYHIQYLMLPDCAVLQQGQHLCLRIPNHSC